MKSLQSFLIPNLSLHLGNHSQFLPSFLLHKPTWSGLFPSLLTTFILVQNRSVRTKINWLSCSFPKEISVNKWKPCSEGKYIQHYNLASKLRLKYKSHMSWNKMTYSVVTMHRAGCTTSSWHCLKKLVLNTIWTEPKVFMPQWQRLRQNCVWVSPGGTGQQWSVAGAGALGAADLGKKAFLSDQRK